MAFPVEKNSGGPLLTVWFEMVGAYREFSGCIGSSARADSMNHKLVGCLLFWKYYSEQAPMDDSTLLFLAYISVCKICWSKVPQID